MRSFPCTFFTKANTINLSIPSIKKEFFVFPLANGRKGCYTIPSNPNRRIVMVTSFAAQFFFSYYYFFS